MRKILFAILLFALPVLLAACSSSKPAEAAPVNAPVSISLATNPDPAKVGDVELRFTVLDTQGLPVSGADVDVFADHIDMAGMTMHGKATEQGDGVYAITANFSMDGNWKLTVQVKKDNLDYQMDIPIVIE